MNKKAQTFAIRSLAHHKPEYILWRSPRLKARIPMYIL